MEDVLTLANTEGLEALVVDGRRVGIEDITPADLEALHARASRYVRLVPAPEASEEKKKKKG